MDIRDNASESRFETTVEGRTAVVTYRLDGRTITFEHTIVPEELEGQGIGSALAKAALEGARSKGLKVVPQCPFIKAYIERHPEYRELT